ncbi:MAG: hypothetical protein E4G94_09105 [ANME-2 cluster archaeon]|nr:MAG: hypothetical protein E4G94_09105 [ANME-2 cluster archaeon]
MASSETIFILLYHFGGLLKNTHICNAVERSNNLKKKTRIVEGSRTRVEPDEAELLLKSAELILCIVGLYHLLKGWKGHGSPINLSDVRLIRPA